MVDTAQTSRRATYDILRHYCQLEQSLDEITRAVDKPENGIYLNIGMHLDFDKFKWCLLPTEVRPSNLTTLQACPIDTPTDREHI